MACLCNKAINILILDPASIGVFIKLIIDVEYSHRIIIVEQQQARPQESIATYVCVYRRSMTRSPSWTP